MELTGTVVSGIGHGSDFTRLDWVRERFTEVVGIDPFPGTLNLRLTGPQAQRWTELRERGGQRIPAGDGNSCDARVFPVSLDERCYAAAIYPEVEAYPAEQLEIVAAVDLREQLGLGDGDTLNVRFLAARPVDAVLFDVDGTLLNSLDGYLVAVQRAIDGRGYSVTAEMIRRSLNSTREFWHLVLPQHEHDNRELIHQLRAETMRHWPAARDEHVDVLPGVAPLLNELSRGPLRLGICTGSYGESFPPLERAGLLDLFQSVITGEHVDERKPHPEGILRCLEELDVAADRAVYVGDSVVDIQAARAAGVYAIGVLTGAGDPASLTAHGAHRLLPDATRITELVQF